MLDRLLARLGTWQCLAASATAMLALFTTAWFSGSSWPCALSLPFALAFGMGGAARDLGMATRRRKPRPRRADPLAIAVLEYELLGIEPKPGTAAAFAVGLRRTFGPHDGERVMEVNFPRSMTNSEIDTWRATYEHASANSITVPKPGGGVEILYVDPSGKRPR